MYLILYFFIRFIINNVVFYELDLSKLVERKTVLVRGLRFHVNELRVRLKRLATLGRISVEVVQRGRGQRGRHRLSLRRVEGGARHVVGDHAVDHVRLCKETTNITILSLNLFCKL